ncbi:MAG: peptidase M23 [Ignavibacteria bacterium]|nr:MAG: peptidase M23 [Ignavibacteria bacterium]KAF0162088.1 MAG: peptidase M23 [Ignavibacteria bacterium]
MKKFYYFSKSKLKFVEIRNFYKKFVFLLVFFAILVSFFVFGTFLVFHEFINPDSEVKALKKSNKLLREKFELLVDKYENLDQTVNQLNEKSRELRLKANLDPKNTEIAYGIGGSIFEPIESYNSGEITTFLNEIDTYIDKVSLKVKIEKNNYSEITSTLKQNELLYDAIPAIRPCEGRIADDFGMRFHPILKFVRMHNGIDIITDVGTKVYAPGNGTVESVGWKGGYGLTMEIAHGFGYKTLYAHLESVKVKVGQKVNRGDFVAYSGNTGRLSSGPHLHYEVHHNGVTLDPMNFIYDDVSLFEIVKK